jgi:DNA replication factor GINS
MNLDDLRDAQDRERSSNDLQDLPDSFYADVAEYVEDLKERRDAAADRADDPFEDSEVRRLTDEIDTARQVAEELYEKRVGKIIKRASFAATGSGGDEAGLTAEERALYDDLVDTIAANKDHVLDVVAGDADPPAPDSTADQTPADTPSTDTGPGEASGGVTRPDPDDSIPAEPTDPPATGRDEGVDAADLMGDGPTDPPEAASPEPSTDGGADTPGASPEELTPDAADDGADTARTAVRITRDVGEVFGVDERTYVLEAGDVADLPEENAAPLVERDAAEQL